MALICASVILVCMDRAVPYDRIDRDDDGLWLGQGRVVAMVYTLRSRNFISIHSRRAYLTP